MGGSYLQSMGWDLLVNNLIASSTNTEDVHALLVDFLPRDKYFRWITFNLHVLDITTAICDVSILYNNFLKQFTNRQKYDFMRSIAYIHEQTHIPTFMHSMHAYLLIYLLTCISYVFFFCRFNPQLRSNLAIDEKNKSILTELKQLARDDFQAQLNGPNNPFLQQLFKTLRGDGT